MLVGTKVGDKVSIYVDLSGTCKKGFAKQFIHPKKLLVGNGVSHQDRVQLFGDGVKPRGLAVEVYGSISKCPTLIERDLLEYGALLQNFPSIVCGHVLNPSADDIVLDMCAAPGNKTTHLASLMNNQGKIIALEKVASKIERLKKHCKMLNATNVNVYNYDSTKIVRIDDGVNEKLEGPPPYPLQSFDKILLDAPCSGLGQRPQLRNRMSVKEIQSYPPLQRKLFTAAVQLLKPKGRLVYSTCTITIAENEEIVSWALKTFPQLILIPAVPKFGGAGLQIPTLSEGQCQCLQRFTHLNNEHSVDSLGFFIAHFEKK